MNRYFYADSIMNFLTRSANEILGMLAAENSFNLNDLQKNAWLFEIRLLKNILSNERNGQVLFEYSIPRLGKRVDVVILLKGIVFVLEFKVGAQSFSRQDSEQVWDYALDLKNFHEASRDLIIVPVLIATNAPDSSAIQKISLLQSFKKRKAISRV